MRPIPRTPSLLVALLAIVAFAPGAQAAGVGLRWDSCYGDGGVQNKNFACDTNTGSQTLVGSFTLGANLPQASENVIVLELGFAASTFPQWWAIKGNGACRMISMTFGLAPPGACMYWADPEQAGGGISAYNVGQRGPNTARVVAAVAVPPNAYADLIGGQEYFSFSLTIDNRKTVGNGSCAGCATPGCLVLNSINFVTPAIENILTLSGPAYGNDSDWATWQGGGSVTVGGVTGCPAATPTAKHTWGAVKALYH